MNFNASNRTYQENWSSELANNTEKLFDRNMGFVCKDMEHF